MKIKINKGNIYYFCIVLITILFSLDNLGQLAGRLGLVTMGWVLLLTTRLKIVEDWYGGLDKSYGNHKTLGIASFAMLIAHPILLKMPIILGQVGAINFGVVGLYLMIIGIVLAVVVKIPYDKWKISHKIMGVAFLFGAWHGGLMSQDIVRWWIILFALIGTVSFIYTVFLYKFIGPKFDYKVIEVETKGDVVMVEMETNGRKMNYQSGQFAYFQFEDQKVGKEVHPFSLTSDPKNNRLSIAVKKLGDYSSRMGRLTKGTRVIIWGPYGKFFHQSNSKKQIWVAAGIGITPFLSMVNSVKNKNVVLFYLTRNKEEAVFNNQLKKINNLKIYNWYSEEKGRINVDDIKNKVGNTDDYEWFVCGSSSLMSELKEQVAKNNNYNYENFNFLG